MSPRVRTLLSSSFAAIELPDIVDIVSLCDPAPAGGPPPCAHRFFSDRAGAWASPTASTTETSRT